MFKKSLLILFIILLSSVYAIASNNVKQIAEKLIEYNNEDFKNSMSQENIKIFIDYITSDDYVISPEIYNKLDLLRAKISNEDMKKISLKLEKDIEIYAKRQYDDIQQSLMYQIEKSGILDNNFTRKTINKYYKADIKYSTVLKHTKIYYNHSLTNQYPELAKVILQHINLKEFNKEVDVVDIFWDSLMESGMEVHHEDADVTYVYNLKTPLKIKGIFTLSNTRDYDYYELNKGKPKTDFESYDKRFALMGMYIKAKNFIYGNNRYANILSLSEDISGEVNYDAEITIKPGSKIILDRAGGENSIDIYVEEIKLNKIISSVKYDNNEYKDERHNIDIYKLTSSDGYVNVRNSPNGKVIKKININSSEDYIVYYFKGLYKFEDLAGYPYNEKSSAKSYTQHYNKINKLLNTHGMNIGSWYKVVYFPKNTYKIDDAVIGYIHSSQMEKIRGSEEYFNEY